MVYGVSPCSGASVGLLGAFIMYFTASLGGEAQLNSLPVLRGCSSLWGNG